MFERGAKSQVWCEDAAAVRENGAVTEEHQARRATIRRAPRFGVFVGVGVVIGIIVAVVLTLSFAADPNVGMLATIGYVSLYGVAAGAVLGAVAALIADRVSRRRAKLVEVERGVVEPAVPERAEGAADQER